MSFWRYLPDNTQSEFSCISVLDLFEWFRGSHRKSSVKVVLGNFACQRFFFNKVAGIRSATSKKSIWHRCFPVNFSKFPRTPFLQNTSGQLLLTIQKSFGLIFPMHRIYNFPKFHNFANFFVQCTHIKSSFL